MNDCYSGFKGRFLARIFMCGNLIVIQKNEDKFSNSNVIAARSYSLSALYP